MFADTERLVSQAQAAPYMGQDGEECEAAESHADGKKVVHVSYLDFRWIHLVGHALSATGSLGIVE